MKLKPTRVSPDNEEMKSLIEQGATLNREELERRAQELSAEQNRQQSMAEKLRNRAEVLNKLTRR